METTSGIFQDMETAGQNVASGTRKQFATSVVTSISEPTTVGGDRVPSVGRSGRKKQVSEQLFVFSHFVIPSLTIIIGR
jgi:hypothetical protein